MSRQPHRFPQGKWESGDVFDFNIINVFGHDYNLSNALKHGGWHMNPSKALSSEGEIEPWRVYSIMKQEYKLAPR